MSDLRELRTAKRLTQQEVADRIGVSLRSYVSYENDKEKANTPKYRFLLRELEAINPVDEEHGILSVDDIIEISTGLLSQYNVDYCYLFGSYAKGTPSPSSDIDLLISTTTTGLEYYELVERLRQALHKKVDVLDFAQLAKNEDLLNDILKEGIRIYG